LIGDYPITWQRPQANQTIARKIGASANQGVHTSAQKLRTIWRFITCNQAIDQAGTPGESKYSPARRLSIFREREIKDTQGSAKCEGSWAGSVAPRKLRRRQDTATRPECLVGAMNDSASR